MTTCSAKSMTPVSEAARLLMVSDERLRQLVKLSYIKPSVRGHYEHDDVIQGYIKFLKDEERKGSKVAAQSRMQDAKTAEIELRLAEKQRSVIPLDDAIYAIEFAAAKFRDAMLSLPARFTRDMGERRKLEALVHEEVNNIGKAFGSARRYVRDGGADLHASEGDDPSEVRAHD
ncbi:hypothetical protein [Rhizobium grahamii]|uniref:Uncharacterized protein n=1 Tax=Rhizobium grahamii CCGE 502 TaxID=990285 RepID=S3HI21_9HYPH|nr:hypothetical protein [Rhizobium grahamii]EPE98439.1 hypothetical protein RGCCGE502_08430 [Rhizobium grahamii CCGE 502]